MKICVFVLFLVVACAACSNEKSSDQKVVAQINNYKIYIDDFQNQLAEELEFEKDYKLTEESKRQFLNELIRKEVLIQEAKRMDLDLESEFVKTIESYWESTLIRNLVAKKSADISKRILVSEEEILERFNMVASNASGAQPTLESVRQNLENEIRENKKSAALQAWMEELHQKAKVTIDTSLLLKN